MTKLPPEWVRTSDPVIRSPARYRWTTAPACSHTSEDVIKSMVPELRKPHIEVARFSGDPLTYQKFVRQFETCILAVTDNEDERLAYLDQYTS